MTFSLTSMENRGNGPEHIIIVSFVKREKGGEKGCQGGEKGCQVPFLFQEKRGRIQSRVESGDRPGKGT